MERKWQKFVLEKLGETKGKKKRELVRERERGWGDRKGMNKRQNTRKIDRMGDRKTESV